MAKVADFRNEAKPNVHQWCLVAQAIAGPALKGGELADVSPTAEQSALGKLLANWNAVTPALPRRYPGITRSLSAHYPLATQALPG